MSDTALFAFQFAEVADSLWSVFCALLFLLGAGIWIHATYFREGE